MLAKKNTLTLVSISLSLLVISTLLYTCISLLCLHGALASVWESILFYWRARDFFPPLMIAVIATFVQWHLHCSQAGRFQWLPLAIGLAGLVLSDILWLCSNDYGGHILAELLIRAAGPVCVGSITALALVWLKGQSRPAKYIAASLLLVALTGCLWSWPRPLTDRIDIRFDGKAAFYNETSMSAEVQLSREDLESLLFRADIYPCLKEQHWKGEWAMAVRLNEQYILMAPRDGISCIYEYSGDLAAFDLTRPVWAVHSKTLHYDGLMLYSTGWSAKEASIVGVWEGSGTVSVIGENAPDPAEITEIWTFSEDGTATVEIVSPEMPLPAIEYTYALEQGVLTLTANGRSVEFPCALDAETMTLDDTLVFTRIE